MVTLTPINQKKSQFEPGFQLSGKLANYEIIGVLGVGGFGETYKAKVSKLSLTDSPGLTLGREVVIKIPTLDFSRSYTEITKRLAEAHEKFLIEYGCMKRLHNLECVAQVLDYGSYVIRLHEERIESIESPTFFFVQQLIKGDPLNKYLAEKQKPEADTFFAWATKLIKCLIAIHQRQIVHGDIWPPNILIQKNDSPVFIDFGQALFRDLVINGIGIGSGSHVYIAPEGSGSVSADIYSFGCVLFYLATRNDPPLWVKTTKDIDELKLRISETIERDNPLLYEQNSGIVNIIARCIRYNQHNRIPHAEGVLQDIETFSLIRLASTGINDLVTSYKDLSKTSTPLFSWMAGLRIRVLNHVLEDMTNGVYDLIGSHEDIVNGLTQYLSSLQKGDQYLTISLPSFWHSANLGINGRFLSMNKIAAQRGAVIRRVFLITEKDKRKDPQLTKILRSHVRIIKELNSMGIPTNDAGVNGKGYFTGFKIISEADRHKIVKQGKHFGLLVKGGRKILIAPVYRDDGVIVTIQFRAQSDLVDGLGKYFQELLESSRVLSEYQL